MRVNMNQNMFPFEQVAQMIAQYIYEKKGIGIKVKTPSIDDTEEVEKFLKLGNIAMAYFGL